eukprot:7721097-Alexandrium_andersonii.AAC.1
MDGNGSPAARSAAGPGRVSEAAEQRPDRATTDGDGSPAAGSAAGLGHISEAAEQSPGRAATE